MREPCAGDKSILWTDWELWPFAAERSVQVTVQCHVRGGSVDSLEWLGPGLRFNSSVYQEAELLGGRAP